jgi:hypothetical protein
MKRQRGRHNGRKPHHPHNPNLPLRAQTFDSSGPDVRIRGNAFQVLEKYLAFARDAAAIGDRIAAENYYQHAEHYYRLINESGGYNRPNPNQPQMQGQGQQGQGQGQGQGSMPGMHDPQRGGGPYPHQHDPMGGGQMHPPGIGPQPTVVMAPSSPLPGFGGPRSGPGSDNNSN